MYLYKCVLIVSILFTSIFTLGQTCPKYTSTGSAFSGYIAPSFPDCASCPTSEIGGPWTGATCGGTIIVTPTVPTTEIDLAFFAVNTDDFATITTDGGGVLTVIGDGVDVAGTVIGPYTCAGPFGDVIVSIESTLPFTTVTITNTGCSSGWVITCPDGGLIAGADDLTATSCGGIVLIEDLLSLDADAGGDWTETSGSGIFDPLTTEFDSDAVPPEVYTFEYAVLGCDGLEDIAQFALTVFESVSAGADNSMTICNDSGAMIDLNTLLSGADSGGIWLEVTSSGGFDPLTGVFDVGGIAAGDYTFTYTVPGMFTCPDDVATFIITINEGAVITIISDPVSGVICEGEMMTLTASGAGLGGTYVWDFGVVNGVPFTPPSGETTYTVTATTVEGCVSTESVEIFFSEPVSAGEDNTGIICSDLVSTIDLNTLLIDADPGGIWSETTMSGSFDALTGIFDGSGLVGDYSFVYTVSSGGPCPDDVANFIITVVPPLEIEIISDPVSGVICEGEMMTLTASGAGLGGTYVWDFGVVNGVPFTPPSGETTYTVTATTVEGCVSTESVEIFFSEPISAGEDNTGIICGDLGSTIDLNTLLIDADPGGVWSETTMSGSFDVFTGVFDGSGLVGDYSFIYTVSSGGPCPSDIANFIITVSPPIEITIVSDPLTGLVCDGNDVILSASGAGLGGTYVWNLGITNGIPFTPSIGTTTYTVTATDVNGCVNTETIDIIANPIPPLTFIGDTLIGCDMLNVRFDNLTVLGEATCTWDFGDGSSATGCEFVLHNFNTPGEYDVTLTVETEEGCSSTVTYEDYISVTPLPIAAFSFSPNLVSIEDTEVSFENSSEGASLYEWDFSDGSSISNEFEPIHNFPVVPNATYNVQLVAKNNDVCADTTIQVIEIQDIIIFYVPNVFTPDGDNFNESFQPVITSGIDIFDYHLTIFNRYGETVFESFNKDIGWDGTYGDRVKVQDEVYIWSIEFGDTRSDRKHEYRGHVTILN